MLSWLNRLKSSINFDGSSSVGSWAVVGLGSIVDVVVVVVVLLVVVVVRLVVVLRVVLGVVPGVVVILVLCLSGSCMNCSFSLL